MVPRSLEDRPGLAALIERAKAMPNAIVVVYSVSRLARRQRLLWKLLDDRDGFGLPVVSATEPFDAASPMGKSPFASPRKRIAMEATAT